MAEFLIQALNETAPMRYWRGDIINVYEDGGIGTPIAPQYVAIRVPGLELSTAIVQREEWWLRIAFNVISNNPVTDTFILRVEATQFNPISGLGKLTTGKVETFLSNWGATGISFTNSIVTFTIAILDAIKSLEFWRGLDLTGLVLTETDYVQSTGTHTCRVNYSNSTVIPNELKMRITMGGGVVIAENTGNKTITFTIDRQAVRSHFETEVKQRTEGMIVRRKFRISEVIMQYAEANNRDITVSVGDYNTYWRNKLTE